MWVPFGCLQSSSCHCPPSAFLSGPLPSDLVSSPSPQSPPLLLPCSLSRSSCSFLWINFCSPMSSLSDSGHRPCTTWLRVKHLGVDYAWTSEKVQSNHIVLPEKMSQMCIWNLWQFSFPNVAKPSLRKSRGSEQIYLTPVVPAGIIFNKSQASSPCESAFLYEA